MVAALCRCSTSSTSRSSSKDLAVAIRSLPTFDQPSFLAAVYGDRSGKSACGAEREQSQGCWHDRFKGKTPEPSPKHCLEARPPSRKHRLTGIIDRSGHALGRA